MPYFMYAFMLVFVSCVRVCGCFVAVLSYKKFTTHTTRIPLLTASVTATRPATSGHALCFRQPNRIGIRFLVIVYAREYYALPTCVSFSVFALEFRNFYANLEQSVL